MLPLEVVALLCNGEPELVIWRHQTIARLSPQFLAIYVQSSVSLGIERYDIGHRAALDADTICAILHLQVNG